MRRVKRPGLVLVCCLAATSRLGAQDRAPKLSGFLQLRETYQRHLLSATVNRARVYLDGGLATHFSYRLSADFGTGGASPGDPLVSLVDAFIRWTPSSAWGFTVGQFKTPFSREYLLQPSALEMADRAAVTESLPPKRDIGVMATYAVGSTASVLAGAFNGEGDNAVSNTDSTLLAVGRVTVRRSSIWTSAPTSRPIAPTAPATASTECLRRVQRARAWNTSASTALPAARTITAGM